MQKKNVTIDDLAGMIKRGFDETAKKHDVDLLSFQIRKLDKRIARVEDLLALK